MNIDNLKRLKEWLDAGGDGIRFDMRTGLYVEPDCGTTCCIAGAAAFMSAGAMPGDIENQTIASLMQNSAGEVGPRQDRYIPWSEIRGRALAWLGAGQDDSIDSYRLEDLFCADMAPAACTTKQAAEAVQRVIDGKFPWEHPCRR